MSVLLSKRGNNKKQQATGNHWKPEPTVLPIGSAAKAWPSKAANLIAQVLSNIASL